MGGKGEGKGGWILAEDSSKGGERCRAEKMPHTAPEIVIAISAGGRKKGILLVSKRDSLRKKPTAVSGQGGTVEPNRYGANNIPGKGRTTDISARTAVFWKRGGSFTRRQKRILSPFAEKAPATKVFQEVSFLSGGKKTEEDAIRGAGAHRESLIAFSPRERSFTVRTKSFSDYIKTKKNEPRTTHVEKGTSEGRGVLSITYRTFKSINTAERREGTRSFKEKKKVP